MRALLQRVRSAAVDIDGETVGRIDHGLLVYVGVAAGDDPSDVQTVADKIRHIRIFPDRGGKMNLDVVQAGGSVLLVSSFTLHADTRRGRRPAFAGAADPQRAEALYDAIRARLSDMDLDVQTGRFRAMMRVSSVNDGPINVLIDSKS